MEEVREPVLKVPMEGERGGEYYLYIVEAAGGKGMTSHLRRFLLELSQPPERSQ